MLAVAGLLSGVASESAGAGVVDADSPSISLLRSWLASSEDERGADVAKIEMTLSRHEAEIAVLLLSKDCLARLAVERKSEIDAKALIAGDKTLRWLEKISGKEPAGGRSLWISLHGGGAVPQVVNDQQWLNQIHLYEPAEGIYVAPRAPSDAWNLWHEKNIDPMFQRLIEDYVAVCRVNPDKVYLLGYSAGGEGVWQLAPRMADRFAAASAMAGHPNNASLDGLRNLPFALFVGGNDGAYERNTVALEKTAELDRLLQADPGGYVHLSRIYEGLGHWMNGKDAEALPWMAEFARNPWPKKIVWVQGGVTHDRFYWLKMPSKTTAKEGQMIVATVEGQTIQLEGDLPRGMTLLLSDDLLDLDEPITVIVNHTQVSNSKIPRTAFTIRECLKERPDPPAAATARFIVP